MTLMRGVSRPFRRRCNRVCLICTYSNSDKSHTATASFVLDAMKEMIISTVIVNVSTYIPKIPIVTLSAETLFTHGVHQALP